jgi:adenylate cyclase
MARNADSFGSSEASNVARNIELKARLRNFSQAQETAARLSGSEPERLRQVDTYFRCSTGRLKLREIVGTRAELIAYRRPDVSGPKASDYRIVPVENSKELKEALQAALGVWTVVEKHREVYLIDNVRIHLDRVEGLGEFLEFEAVLEPAMPDAAGEQLLAHLADEFRLDADDLIEGSYSDMVPA